MLAAVTLDPSSRAGWAYNHGKDIIPPIEAIEEERKPLSF